VIKVVERIRQNGAFRALLARFRGELPGLETADGQVPARADDPTGHTDAPGQANTGAANAPATSPTTPGSADAPIVAEGLWGSFAAVLAGAAAGELRRPLLYITAHLDQADEVRDDLELFCGVDPELLSAFETTPGEGAASDEIHAERVRLCAKLQDLVASRRAGGNGNPQDHEALKPLRPTGARKGRSLPADPSVLPVQHSAPIIIAPVQALMQAVPSPAALEASLLTLSVGLQREPHRLADWLVDHGYTRLDQVESPGDFALRGEILDIYPPGDTEPYRIDFFGDTVESIRRFDVSTQRSEVQFDSIRIPAAAASETPKSQHLEKQGSQQAAITSFLSYLPADTIVAIAEPTEVQEIGRTLWNRLGSPRGMMPVERLFQRSADFTQFHLHTVAASGADDVFDFGVHSLTRFEIKTSEALDELSRLADERDVLLYCDNEPERQRFGELWQSTFNDTLPKRLQLTTGLMHRGFDWPAGRLAVVGHHEVFHRYQQRRRIRRTHAARPIESWLDLSTGDYVVHLVHGIARFTGMRTMRKGTSAKSEEYLTLEFAEHATMHVPVSQIDLVQKYIGAGASSPPLSKLGGTRWSKTKERVAESVGDLAAELLRLQAMRASQPGIAYPDDTQWQREFEGGFIYTETEDQLTALDEIKRDMRRPGPMDRLLCGDVGYGKTELAIRAAFKAVEYGKQVAVLVPTTVLAEQHERTFRERLADFPFRVDSLSRFKTKKQQEDTISRARKGQVDVLIGTHRLLSKDVGFKDLGLLVVDEEQRFGVEHKERLKRFRETVDVLTMSATPIPRTLHMSLLGIRDISSLATPPMDRRSIVTQVTHWNDAMIREAIVRELNRDGQVYFVHNFVHDILTFADKVRQIVPEARILIGHGQMKEHELEKVMVRFIRHEADVLVCTTIIESGLDIPNCNTMLIDRADRFGLSDLHQLRGRVGRYKHRAYCYLLLSQGSTMTATAAKRLKAIEEYSELGAGFRIAMRDLEIRGAGNILGPEQSGFIGAVGYELYCQLLDTAVHRLKGEPVDTFRPVHLELDVPAHIPRNYIDSDRQRMEIYRRLVRCRTKAELAQLEQDIRDAFGPYPPSVQTLLDLAEIRILAQPFKIQSITQAQPDLIFVVEEMGLLEPVFANSPGSPRIADANTVHLRLSDAYFEPATLLPVLRRMLGGLHPPAAKSIIAAN
jgi:transcription-repair coupling factor (superfamily II helicase)